MVLSRGVVWKTFRPCSYSKCPEEVGKRIRESPTGVGSGERSWCTGCGPQERPRDGLGTTLTLCTANNHLICTTAVGTWWHWPQCEPGPCALLAGTVVKRNKTQPFAAPPGAAESCLRVHQRSPVLNHLLVYILSGTCCWQVIMMRHKKYKLEMPLRNMLQNWDIHYLHSLDKIKERLNKFSHFYNVSAINFSWSFGNKT